jgi:DNA-binding transcriptional MerR regulator
MTSAIAAALPARTKSPEAFRTISEASLELDVPQHVLRFWETRFKQVHPVKRAGGRRFYRPEDVALLRGIRSLLYAEGYTIKGVQKVLRDRGWRHVAELGRIATGEAPWGMSGDLDHDADNGSDDSGENDADNAGEHDADNGCDNDRGAFEAAALSPQEAMETLRRVHDEAAYVMMDETKRVRLELLLAQLLVMRDRLRSVRGKD